MPRALVLATNSTVASKASKGDLVDEAIPPSPPSCSLVRHNAEHVSEPIPHPTLCSILSTSYNPLYPFPPLLRSAPPFPHPLTHPSTPSPHLPLHPTHALVPTTTTINPSNASPTTNISNAARLSLHTLANPLGAVMPAVCTMPVTEAALAPVVHMHVHDCSVSLAVCM